MPKQRHPMRKSNARRKNEARGRGVPLIASRGSGLPGRKYAWRHWATRRSTRETTRVCTITAVPDVSLNERRRFMSS